MSTIRDVAAKAGVNASTVSRWLNQSGRPADPETVPDEAEVRRVVAHPDVLG